MRRRDAYFRVWRRSICILSFNISLREGGKAVSTNIQTEAMRLPSRCVFALVNDGSCVIILTNKNVLPRVVGARAKYDVFALARNVPPCGIIIIMGKFPNTEPPREMVEKLLVNKRRVWYEGINADFSKLRVMMYKKSENIIKTSSIIFPSITYNAVTNIRKVSKILSCSKNSFSYHLNPPRMNNKFPNCQQKIQVHIYMCRTSKTSNSENDQTDINTTSRIHPPNHP